MTDPERGCPAVPSQPGDDGRHHARRRVHYHFCSRRPVACSWRPFRLRPVRPPGASSTRRCGPPAAGTGRRPPSARRPPAPSSAAGSAAPICCTFRTATARTGWRRSCCPSTGVPAPASTRKNSPGWTNWTRSSPTPRNGGGFAGLLSCRLAGRIAASAQVSGAFYPQGGACDPSRPTPVIEFHGSADATIPYDGNPAKGLPPIQSWLADWARRDRCAAGPVTSTPVPGVTRFVWRVCAAGVEHYKIDGLGHTWPSTTPNPDSATPSVVDATPIIWRFFRDHPLPIGPGCTH